MRYLPHTEQDISAMLDVIGVDSMDALFGMVPADNRRTAPLALPEPMTEWELNDWMDQLASRQPSRSEICSFLGAGSYAHHIPSVVPALLSRSEFFTAYTPYQPEVSQGTLQAIYEYQTLTARLLGMEVANASMYDGASSLAEALLMAIRVTKRNKIAVSKAIHPHYREVLRTYFDPTGFEIVELPFGEDGRTDLSQLGESADLAAVALQSPNFFGVIEDLSSWAETVHQDPKTLLVAAFSEALAFGLLKSPGECGADIVCGEGQSLGIPQSFGGPALGMLATRAKLQRNLPGRLVGRTVDSQERPGFVLTLATREQHIRREKATSNICTNQGLCALASTIYMASSGKTGLKQVAQLNHDKAEYLKSQLIGAGIPVRFSGPTFNEFVVTLPDGAYQKLLEQKIVAGLPLETFYSELKNAVLLCATEVTTREQIDTLVKEVQS